MRARPRRRGSAAARAGDLAARTVDVMDPGRAADGEAPAHAADLEVDQAGIETMDAGSLELDIVDRERDAAAPERVANDQFLAIARAGERDPLRLVEVVAKAGRSESEDGRAGAALGHRSQRRRGRVDRLGPWVDQRRKQVGLPFQQAGIGLPVEKAAGAKQADEEVTVGDEPVDLGATQGRGQPGGRHLPGRSPGDQLGEHRVVVGADHGAVLDAGVEAQAGRARPPPAGTAKRSPPGTAIRSTVPTWGRKPAAGSSA